MIKREIFLRIRSPVGNIEASIRIIIPDDFDHAVALGNGIKQGFQKLSETRDFRKSFANKFSDFPIFISFMLNREVQTKQGVDACLNQGVKMPILLLK